MKGICLLTANLLMLFLAPKQALGMYKNICRLFADGVKVRDPVSCDSFLTCNNLTGVSTKCPENQIFSIVSKKCVKSEEGCSDPCAPDLDSIWLADPKSCYGYFFCSKGVGMLGTCPSGQHFNEEKQECIYSSESKCKGGDDKFCHIVPNDIKFKDENTCEKFYVCEKNVLKSKNCAAGQWFDRQTGECAAKTSVKDCNLIPQGICMNGKKIEKNKFVPDRASCRGHYYCKDKGSIADTEPTWNQCPEGTFFSYSTQSCSDPVTVSCNEDRCDGRGNLFVNSEKNCQHYLVCKDGVTAEEKKCAHENFFDEKRQACTSEVIEYKICT